MTIQYRPEPNGRKGERLEFRAKLEFRRLRRVTLPVNLQPVSPSWVVVITIITYLYSIRYWFHVKESPVLSSLASSLHAPFHSRSPRGLHFPLPSPPKGKGSLRYTLFDCLGTPACRIISFLFPLPVYCLYYRAFPLRVSGPVSTQYYWPPFWPIPPAIAHRPDHSCTGIVLMACFICPSSELTAAVSHYHLLI